MQPIERERAIAPSSRSNRRHGVTLVELMITLVLLGIVAGGMMQIIVKQQRFYNGNSSVLGTRGNVRQGVAVFQSDLRAINPTLDISAGDMKATSLEFREPRGSSAICAIDASSYLTIVVPPPVLSNDAGLTSWVQPPEVGDSLLVFDPASRTWLGTARVITGSKPTEGSGTCTGLVKPADLARGWRITVAPALPSTVAVGAPVRFFRHAGYQLKQAADGDWYLSFFDCNDTRTPKCDEPQPIAGPYLSAGSTPPGLQLDYFNASGIATTTPAMLRRIDITLRSQSSAQVNMDGRVKGFYKDSLKTSIALRNIK